jgi:hypothetical protein
VLTASSGMDEIDRHQLFLGPSVEIAPVLVRYRVSFSTAVFPQLRLWRLHCLVSVQSVGYVHSRVPVGVSLPASRKRCSSLRNALAPG